MLFLAIRNLQRRPLRNALTVAGLAAAIAVFASLSGFENGYRESLRRELDRMGMQAMLVPLGCPFDAATRVLKGRPLENTLPESALAEVLTVPEVADAAPLLLNAVPRPREKRVDMWVGLDERAMSLKPWWRAATGTNWFHDAGSVILGSDAAELEMRSVGDRFFEPQTGMQFKVSGVLERSGTSDDSLFFIPLQTAQRTFKAEGRLTAIAIRLKDPRSMREAAARLQRIPGAQVVTATEMMGVFVNLVSASRALMQGLGLLAVAISLLTVFNTLLATVLERSAELALLRAVGASAGQLLRLTCLEGLLLCLLAALAGLVLVVTCGGALEAMARRLVPLAPEGRLLALSPEVIFRSVGLAAVVAVLGGLYPAWRASRMPPEIAAKDL